MHDAVGVRASECVEQLGHEVTGLGERKNAPSLEHTAQRLSWHIVVGREEFAAPRLSAVDQAHDVRMMEICAERGLPQEPLAMAIFGLVVNRAAKVQKLERDDTLRVPVDGAIDVRE